MGVLLLFVISTIVLSPYAAGLLPKFRDRYINKIKVINIDPFTDVVKFKGQIQFPPTSLIEIYNYFVLFKSFYMGEDLKA